MTTPMFQFNHMPLDQRQRMEAHAKAHAQRVARIKARRAKLAAQRLPTVVADGGRATAGLPMGKRRDCVSRAISIVTGQDYAEVWQAMKPFAHKGNPDKGVYTVRASFHEYMLRQGFLYTSCLSPRGRAGRVKLRKGDLPMGKLVVITRRHAQAVVDGVVHDTASTQSPSVRGYWTLQK